MRVLAIVLCLLLLPSPALAQDWAERTAERIAYYVGDPEASEDIMEGLKSGAVYVYRGSVWVLEDTDRVGVVGAVGGLAALRIWTIYVGLRSGRKIR